MSTDGMDQILLATTAGAFAQAMGRAARSDSSAREDLWSRNRRSGVLAPARSALSRAGVVHYGLPGPSPCLYDIALSLGLFSL